MFFNYLKIALRNIRKHKAFSFINITGLAVGMACCVLILLWIRDELSYDRFHQNHKELYRTSVNEEGRWWSSSPWALAPLLKEKYPEIENATRIANRNIMAAYEDKSFNEATAFVDPDFFSMFTFPFVEGNPESAFSALESIVLTESAAQRYFGQEQAMGKALTINGSSQLTVTGIIKDVPSNSHLDFDMVAPVRTFGDGIDTSWSYESACYILLQKNASPEALQEKIAGIVMEYDKRVDTERTLHIRPITRLHLHSDVGDGSITNIYLFGTIALFILIIACINFMNLATARGSTRAKEVGMRKVVGAQKKNIIRQFFGESILISVLSLFLAVVLVLLLLPAFNNLAQKSLRLNSGGNLFILLGLLAIALFTGLAAGSYPALFLSSFRPIRVLRGGHLSDSKKPFLRRALVILQFTIAVILILGTLVVFRQLNFIRHRDLGFNREQVISLPINRAITASYDSFKNELLQNSGVVQVTAAISRPNQVGNVNPVYWEGRGPDQYQAIRFVSADFDYIKTFEMEIVAGRDFSRDFPTDRENYIVNEETVKLMGMEDPVGKLFSIWEREGQIIGVVKNFHLSSLRNEIEPLVITMYTNVWRPAFVFVKIKADNTEGTLKDIENTWNAFAPGFPFDFLFLDESFERMYQADQRAGTIFKYFTILAIFISCLGIFGLSAFTAEQRTKEIGIRKVLGASMASIIALVSKEFVILLALANAVAWPLSFIIMNRMLSAYAYRTNIPLWLFLLSGVLAVTVALLTVSFQAFKAARTDPARALRYE